DSSTFGPAVSKSGIRNMQVQGANQQRPYLRLGANWTLDTTPNSQSVLTIEGLWIGGSGAFSVILAGDYETVTIRHSTLDPGGTNAMGTPITPLPLVISGHVAHVVVDHSIVARLPRSLPRSVNALPMPAS